jgi:hypothetical protein
MLSLLLLRLRLVDLFRFIHHRIILRFRQRDRHRRRIVVVGDFCSHRIPLSVVDSARPRHVLPSQTAQVNLLCIVALATDDAANAMRHSAVHRAFSHSP